MLDEEPENRKIYDPEVLPLSDIEITPRPLRSSPLKDILRIHPTPTGSQKAQRRNSPLLLFECSTPRLEKRTCEAAPEAKRSVTNHSPCLITQTPSDRSPRPGINALRLRDTYNTGTPPQSPRKHLKHQNATIPHIQLAQTPSLRTPRSIGWNLSAPPCPCFAPARALPVPCPEFMPFLLPRLLFRPFRVNSASPPGCRLHVKFHCISLLR